MKRFLTAAFFALFLAGCTNKNDAQLVMPSKEQVVWADSEIGVIIHLDINIYAPNTFRYDDRKTLPPVTAFNPSNLNTDQWIESAKAAGAKYAVLVAKHGTGFALWPTEANDYHIGNTPWKNGKGDIVADFIASCKKFNIRPGVYYNTNMNSLYGAGYTKLSAIDQAEYNKIVLKQLTELWTQYGAWFEIWFDGGVMTDEKGGIASQVSNLINEHQPQAILFQGPSDCKNLIRWVGNEDGRAPYPHWSTTDFSTSSLGTETIVGLHGNPDGKIWCPGEADFPNRKKTAWEGGWLWHEGQESHLFSAEDIVDRYFTSVGRNANMLIGMVIDTSGQFPSADAEVFKEFGREINRLFNEPIAKTKGKGEKIELKISNNPAAISHIVIQEDIAKGERIREYKIEGWIHGSWKPICSGSSIGHKRIHKIPEIETTKIRINIAKSAAQPRIKELAVYSN